MSGQLTATQAMAREIFHRAHEVPSVCRWQVARLLFEALELIDMPAWKRKRFGTFNAYDCRACAEQFESIDELLDHRRAHFAERAAVEDRIAEADAPAPQQRRQAAA